MTEFDRQFPQVTVVSRLFVCLVCSFMLLAGCAEPPAESLHAGPLQIGNAGSRCSMYTSIFDGPITARGRNEGFVKTKLEIRRLFPLFNLPTIKKHMDMADTGMSLAEYYDREDRHAINLNKYSDNRQTIEVVEKRGLISSERANALRRLLVQIDFLDTDTLVDARANNAITVEEGRAVMLEWFNLVGFLEYRNLYLLSGNKNMVAKLVDHKFLSPMEGRYLLLMWSGNLPHLTPTFLDDLQRFGGLEDSKIETLAEREFCYFQEKLQSHGAESVAALSTNAAALCSATSRKGWSLLQKEIKRQAGEIEMQLVGFEL